MRDYFEDAYEEAMSLNTEQVVEENTTKDYWGEGEEKPHDRFSDDKVFINYFDDPWFYCSSSVKYSKRIILKYLIQCFDSKGVDEIEIGELYRFLQKELNIVVVNRNELLKLISNKKKVEKKEIVNLLNKNEKIWKEKEKLSVPDIYRCTSKIHFKTIIILGYVVEMFRTRTSNEIEFEEVYQFLQVKLNVNNVNRDNLKTILPMEGTKVVKNKLFGLYNFLKEREQKELLRKVEETKSLFKDIHPDNYCLIMENLVDKEVGVFFKSKGIFTVKDFSDISVSNLQLMIDLFPDKTYDLLFVLKNSIKKQIYNDFYNMVVIMPSVRGKENQKWQKYLAIINMRVAGNTLQACGDPFGITRERVRQLEKKYKRFFNDYYYSTDLINKIKSFAVANSYITKNEIKLLFKQYSDLLEFLLSGVDSEDLLYVEDKEVFLFNNESNWIDYLQNTIDEMPNRFNDEYLESVLQDVQAYFSANSVDLPISIVKDMIVSKYKLSGTEYSTNGLSLIQKYYTIVKDDYPNGIHISDRVEMEKFKEKFIKRFGEKGLPKNDHAIGSTICRFTILCNKGTYKIKNESLSKGLLDDICEYIDHSDQEIFLTNQLFAVFKDRLLNENVTNKYYLQGLLHSELPNKYFFTRDYVSKNKNETSIYSSIRRYVKDNGVVTKDEIKNVFKGVTDIVIGLSFQSDDIVVGFAKYYHKDFFLRYQNDLDSLELVTKQLVSDGKVHNTGEILEKIKNDYPEIVFNLQIENRYTLFSILSFWFENDYSFDRPFIANKGIEIKSPVGMIKDLLSIKVETPVTELTNFMYNNGIVFNSIIELVDSLDGEYVFKDKSTIINSTLLELDVAKITKMDNAIKLLLNGEDFDCVSTRFNFEKLPDISIKWNEWALYSCVKHFSSEFDVFPSELTFSLAKPIIVRKRLGIDDLSKLKQYLKYLRYLDDSEIENLLKQKGIDC